VCDIVRGLENFPDYWKNYEPDVFLIWMAFEQMNACLKSSLHGRDKNDFEVDLPDLNLVCFCLKFSDGMQTWIVHGGISL
jgi:hypothetical protein